MRAALAALLAGALVLGVGGCRSRVTDPGSRIYCEVMPDPPERNNDDNPTKIIASVRYWCEEPGASTMELTVRLQEQQSNGSWADISTMAFTARDHETVPPDGERFRTRQQLAKCSCGTFRTFVAGATHARGLTKQYEQASPPAVDPCNPGLLAD